MGIPELVGELAVALSQATSFSQDQPLNLHLTHSPVDAESSLPLLEEVMVLDLIMKLDSLLQLRQKHISILSLDASLSSRVSVHHLTAAAAAAAEAVVELVLLMLPLDEFERRLLDDCWR